MTRATAPTRFARGICLLLWLLVIVLPLMVVALDALSSSTSSPAVRPVFDSSLRTCVLAGLIATAAVLLGWLPGRLLGTGGRHGSLVFLLLLMPLVLPRYVLYYAWTLLLSPTTELGRILASRPGLAQWVGAATSTGVLIGWYWPVAALVLAQGWRSIDGRIHDLASLDATRARVFRHITLPLLSRALLLAFGVCFVLSLSEFATFHLAGVETVGTELAVLYELTGTTAPVARAAWPLVLVAVLAAVALTRAAHQWTPTTVPVRTVTAGHRISPWIALALLLVFSWAAPVALLIANVTTSQPFQQFFTLHIDDLAWSLLVAGVAALIAYPTALGAVSCCAAAGLARRVLYLAIPGTIFLAMFLPTSLLAVSLLKLSSISGVGASLRQSWILVSVGQACRFAGLALILLLMTRYPDRPRLAEMASLDGASPLRAWWLIHLPRTWPVLAGTFLLVTMFSFTELSATMVLLPAGLPNFAQRLLNQMHYARDQQVIASCLVLISLFLVLAGMVVMLLRASVLRRRAGVLLLAVVMVAAAGCGADDGDGRPEVIRAFGRTGSGPGEFLYPRAIDLCPDGGLWVVDKTGRIQRLTREGECLGVMQMPLIDAGKPTGMSLHEDGRLFVADTHYHRVAIFSPGGEFLGEIGAYGVADGCFIYPTDVAFAPDGRLVVSEYGGNDRISVFTNDGEFLFSFGSPGSAEEQFARPSAVSIDEARARLYVADACNHRVAVYGLEGRLLGYIGAAGRGPGQVRYPYDLSLMADGTIVVCEYGNNRIQLFSPEGKSLAVYGGPGRQLGRLAFPWGVAVDARRRAYVVDAGNNRIQVWQL